MESIKTNQKQFSSHFYSFNHAGSNTPNLRLNGRNLHVNTPLDLCLAFAQSMNLVLLSHQKLSDGFAIKATFSKVFVSQIESDDDILNVVFAVHKSSFKTATEDVSLMLYLFDDGVNDSQENAFWCSFSLHDWLHHVQVN
ncbi:hypothetical protein ACOV11_19825 [Vibrio natriegens]